MGANMGFGYPRNRRSAPWARMWDSVTPAIVGAPHGREYLIGGMVRS